jgi:hypothetical protein
VVRAATIRLVLTGRLEAPLSYQPDPGGLILEELTILGRLDLNDLRIDLPLCLHDCTMDSGIRAAYSSLQRLELLNCQIGSDGNLKRSALNLRFARIDGAVDLSGSIIAARNAPAVDARNASIAGDVLLRYDSAEHDHYSSAEDSEGAISFVFAEIGGSLILHGTRVANVHGPALNISSARIKGDVNLRDRCQLQGSSSTGAVQVVTTSISGQLDLGNSAISNDIGPALNIRGATVTEDLYLKEGFAATGGTDRGVVRLLQAEIGGRVWIRGATIRNASNTAGAALNCEDISVKRSFTIQKYGDHDCTLTGAGDSATVRLSGATIEGQLAVVDVALSNPSGPAFTASQAHISSGLLLRGLAVSAGGRRGAIRLAGTTVDGMLSVDSALVTRAIAGASDKWDVDGLTYIGYPDVGTWNAGAPAGASSGAKAPAAVSVVVPKLSRTESNSSQSYSRWLSLLTDGTTEYAAQPYQHMAAIAHAAGHEREARRALKEQRHAREDRGRMSRWNKFWSKFYGLSVGYGYEPWRPLFVLAMNIVAALALVFLLFPASIETTQASAYEIRSHQFIDPVAAKSREACRVGDRVVLALDIALPLLRLYSYGNCSVEPEPSLPFTLAILLVQILGWAAATLFVAGFVGVIRRA